jgi:hypothetical protein
MCNDNNPMPPPISTTVLPSILGVKCSVIRAAVSSSRTVKMGADLTLCRSRNAAIISDRSMLL